MSTPPFPAQNPNPVPRPSPSTQIPPLYPPYSPERGEGLSPWVTRGKELGSVLTLEPEYITQASEAPRDLERGIPRGIRERVR
eukprot:1384486-Amorphochlora_amoeboformis.AAC.1